MMDSDNNSENYECQECSASFSEIDLLMKHLKLVHGRGAGSRHICKQKGCQALAFSSASKFKIHLQQKHRFHSSKSLPQEAVAMEIDVEADFDNIHSKNSEHPSSSSTSQLNVSGNESKEKNEKLSPPNVNEDSANEAVLVFLAELYSKPTLSRKTVDEVMNSTENLLKSDFVNLLKKEVKAMVANPGRHSEKDVDFLFKRFQDCLKPFSTEKRRLSYFEKNGNFIKNQSLPIGTTKIQRKMKDKIIPKIISEHVEVVPLKKTLKQFLQLRGVLTEIFDYMHFLEGKNDETVSSFLESRRWKEIKNLFPGKTVLPLLLYMDDYETGNPLGSKKTKHLIAGVYVQLLCLPPQYQASLKRILLAQLFHTASRKEKGNLQIFTYLIDELQDLERNGLEVNFEGSNITIYISLVAIIGDNAGMNAILGFCEGFRGGHYCRICRSPNSECSQMTSENKETVRTELNYEEDANNKAAGVKERCIFNRLKGYNVVKNATVDFTHDWPEGVCRNSLPVVLNSLIYDSAYFSLDYLNLQIKTFPFSSNRPSPITKEQINNKHITMSASEMLTFFKYFSVMVGEKVRVGDEAWQFYLLAREIMEICCSRILDKNMYIYLEDCIDRFNVKFKELCGGALKPKNHFATHYGRVLREMGSIIEFTSIRFEGKHRPSKQYSRVTSNHVKIAYSLALKHQLELFSQFTTHKQLKKIIIGSECPECETYDNIAFHEAEKYICINYAIIDGIKLEKGNMIRVGYDAENDVLQFGKVKLIFYSVEKDEFQIVYNKIITDYYDPHLTSYIISKCNEGIDSLKVISFYSLHPCIAFKLSSGREVIAKWT